MANDDSIAARGGLLPVQFPFGNYKKGMYKLTSAAVATFIGQPMDLDANGGAVPAAITGTSPILGPVVGFLDTNKAGLPSGMTSLSQGSYLPALTDAYVLIADDPDQEFMIQEDTGGSALTAAAVGNLGYFVPRTSSGSTVTGYSTVEFDRSSITATDSAHLLLLGIVDNTNSDGTPNDYGNYATLKVKIYRHRLASKAGGPI